MCDVIVQIQQGKLRGRLAKDIDGNVYKSFQGIPYAKPPIGNLRFLPPQPAEPWADEVLDATKERCHCYSPNFMDLEPKYSGSEDCLFLNVYTPKIENETKEKLPVMVWVHGGAFYLGSGNSDYYGPDYLIAKNIVLVTLNYRLGFLGFLSLKDPSCGVTGNVGLKDQTEALRWVQKNISAFGGDSNNVTLFGESAGSASVSYHLLSPFSKGLFHKAILQSGVILCPWANQTRRDYEFAKILGCTARSDKEILEFLQKQDLEAILAAQEICFPIEVRPCGEVCDITPNIESNNPCAFLSECPEKLLREGRFNKVPLMIGCTDKEGILMKIGLFSKQNDYQIKNDILIPRDLKEILKSDAEIQKIKQKIKDLYCLNKEDKETYDDYWTDVLFAYKNQVYLKEIARNSSFPIYNYLFKYNLKNFKFSCRIFNLENYEGANHGDDLGYLFKNQLCPVEPNSEEAKAVNVMTTLWTNFAKMSNPSSKDPSVNIEWKAFTINDQYYLEIDKELQLKKELFEKRVQFWDDLYRRE